MADLTEFIQKSEVVVHKERYAFLNAKEPVLGDHFMVTQDSGGVTVVTKEENLETVEHTEVEKWFRLFEIKTAIPFEGVGFIAKITKTIADQGLNILVVSTFSQDNILVHDEDVEKAVEALKEVGFPVN